MYRFYSMNTQPVKRMVSPKRASPKRPNPKLLSLTPERMQEVGKLMYKKKTVLVLKKLLIDNKNLTKADTFIMENNINMNECDEIMNDAIDLEDIVVAMFLVEKGLKVKNDMIEKIKNNSSMEFMEMMSVLMTWD